MKLKHAITLQRIAVMISTLLIVIAATAAYVRLFMGNGTVFGNAESLVLVFNNGGEVYRSEGVSDDVIRDLRLAIDIENSYIDIGSVKYSIVRDIPYSEKALYLRRIT